MLWGPAAQQARNGASHRAAWGMMAAMEELARAVRDALRAAGARFAFVHGSRATGSSRPGSDFDVAAWWPGDAPEPWDVALPPGVDLVVLNRAPLELAGRVALRGVLLFDDDPPARVAWQAATRKCYLDEEYRQREHDRVFYEARRG